ncbi:hypothetical protein HBI56_133580 [Parastagonospora nodorum]|uniref:Uncharacterized protein n=1 Tax=Phaeosphaeria nodorum (strain SN15 / ATCC MYA-4574 / FGSC 10173) TaxID=321614 RepID=A0A7U2F9A8_PHANO|nr:hypothetical protein HBH56_036680 [Parastagonospora nodorum]QRD00009.1 hypothetical protein JI435_304890 [Parastagonospora nodorum SN15]KAH3934045.1 hypothetical protein HBH54_062790 [Parastagonospora nodorum]KAH3952764.1 hypothetical protein HBH53_047330 [Parastagonospora nodorum]KAH3979776.1 hypothetical protein HBH51_058330 [Parastagonospora nodorum]
MASLTAALARAVAAISKAVGVSALSFRLMVLLGVLVGVPVFGWDDPVAELAGGELQAHRPSLDRRYRCHQIEFTGCKLTSCKLPARP